MFYQVQDQIWLWLRLAFVLPEVWGRGWPRNGIDEGRLCTGHGEDRSVVCPGEAPSFPWGSHWCPFLQSWFHKRVLTNKWSKQMKLKGYTLQFIIHMICTQDCQLNFLFFFSSKFWISSRLFECAEKVRTACVTNTSKSSETFQHTCRKM